MRCNILGSSHLCLENSFCVIHPVTRSPHNRHFAYLQALLKDFIGGQVLGWWPVERTSRGFDVPKATTFAQGGWICCGAKPALSRCSAECFLTQLTAVSLRVWLSWHRRSQVLDTAPRSKSKNVSRRPDQNPIGPNSMFLFRFNSTCVCV